MQKFKQIFQSFWWTPWIVLTNRTWVGEIKYFYPVTSGVYSYFLFLLSAVWPWGRKAMDTCRTMWKRISPTDSLDCDLSLAINFTELNCWSFFVICYSSSLINKIRYMSAAAAAKSLQSCPTLCDPIDSSLLGSSVPGILQARILEWVAISLSRGSSWSRGQTSVSCIAGRFFTDWTMRDSVMFNGQILKANSNFWICKITGICWSWFCKSTATVSA